MRVAMIDRYRPEPGRLVEFVRSAATRVAADTAPASPVPPSFNQLFHVATADRDPDGPRHWLCFAFDLAGEVDLDALHRAFEHFLARHEALRSSFREAPGGAGADGGVQRFVVPAEKYELAREDHGEAGTPEALRDLLAARLAVRCHPLGDPPHLLSVVLRPGSATVFCGFDHGNMDGYSLTLAVHELHESYRAFASGRTPELPPTDSFVTYCAEEQATPAGPPPGRDHQLVAGWAEFFEGCGSTLPSFPLDLGLPHGTRAPQATDIRGLLDVAEADTFEQRCRAAGGTFFTGALTALAVAARRLGATGGIRLCTPMHTRYEDRWRHSMGWFTTVAPLTLDGDGDGDGDGSGDRDVAGGAGGAGGAVAGAARTKSAFAAARRLAEVPVAQVLPALGDSVRREKDDVFMASYIDYRAFPGSERHVEFNAHHVASVTTTDNVQFWFTRTHEGLFLRSRYPATERATVVVREFVETVGAVLREDCRE
ncbi:hypothetical protein HUT18_19355 [Streptomyces sp. NA04227]|uniref:condensation domain-containing protein n=1 Tax=Streptomyces sp. NA04227 TaxID=2742136 RepID=UPI00158FEEA2|nr:condensation domain-containing protein [Streptomyces sp. NA04227]QKW08215.1 hypothetical protein HUT18_19355 [Streptomyces sp. NA04227]